MNEFHVFQYNQDLIHRVLNAMRTRARICTDRNGGHVEEIIRKLHVFYGEKK